MPDYAESGNDTFGLFAWHCELIVLLSAYDNPPSFTFEC